MASYCPERNHCVFRNGSIPRRSLTTLAGCSHFGLFSQLLEERRSLLVCRLHLPTSGLMHSCPISPVTIVFKVVWKGWIPSDILEILLICWHSPRCPGGNCEAFWKVHLSREPRVWEGAEQTKGKLQKKRFCLILKQTTSEKKSMSILQYADGLLLPVLAQIDPVSYKTMGPDDSMLTSQPVLCGGGQGVQVGGPLFPTVWTLNLWDTTPSQSKGSEVNAHTHTHAQTHYAVS